MSNKEDGKASDLWILLLLIPLVAFTGWIIYDGIQAKAEMDANMVPGQQIEGTFSTETVPVSDGQVECIVLDGPEATGISCNWQDRRTSD